MVVNCPNQECQLKVPPQNVRYLKTKKRKYDNLSIMRKLQYVSFPILKVISLL